MSILEAQSVYSAVAQVCSALQTNLGTVAALYSAIPVDLPVPSADSYFVGMSRPHVDRVLQHADQAIFIVQQRPSEIIESDSLSTPSTRFGAQFTYLEISLFYAMRPVDAPTLYGKTATMGDIMETRGFLYAGILAECLRKYACDGAVIQHVEKASDFAGAYQVSDDGLPIKGIATVVVRLRQTITISECLA